MDPMLVDTYAKDFNGDPNVAALVDAGYPWIGHCMKVSQGLFYPSNNRGYTDEWLRRWWDETKRLGVRAHRYGQDWFRMGYHYADLRTSAKAQRQWMEQNVSKAGGWDHGDLPVCLDMEANQNPAKPGAAKLEDWINEFCEEGKRIDSRITILYGNIYLWENNFTAGARCGAPYIWPAHYLSTLPATVMTRIGYKPGELFAWQLYGTGPTTPTVNGYPQISPVSKEKCDSSAIVIDGGAQTAMKWLRSHTFAEAPSNPPPIPAAA